MTEEKYGIIYRLLPLREPSAEFNIVLDPTESLHHINISANQKRWNFARNQGAAIHALKSSLLRALKLPPDIKRASFGKTQILSRPAATRPLLTESTKHSWNVSRLDVVTNCDFCLFWKLDVKRGQVYRKHGFIQKLNLPKRLAYKEGFVSFEVLRVEYNAV